MAKNKKELFKSVDVISKELDVVDNFVLKYWKRYVYIAIGIVVVIAAVTIFIRVFEHNAATSARELAGASTLDQLKSAVKNNPTNTLAPYAELEIVAKLVDKKEYDSAQKACETIISSSPDTYTLYKAKTDLGYIAEIKGNNADALKVFSQLGADPSAPDSIKAENLYNAGRIYIAMGKKEQAIDALKKCSAISTDSSVGWQEFSNRLLTTLN